MLPLFWQGERKLALAHLQSLRPAGEPPPALEEAIGYLDGQAEWIGNYEPWREQGYPVGSGPVEQAVAAVINLRMKKQGTPVSSPWLQPGFPQAEVLMNLCSIEGSKA